VAIGEWSCPDCTPGSGSAAVWKGKTWSRGQAQPDAVATAWETARAWQRLDPDAARAADRIREEVRTRYGVDVDAPGRDPAKVRQALEQRGLAQEDATDQRSTAAREQVEAARLLAEADRIDRAQDAAAEPEQAAIQDAGEDRYDTARRRQELAASLEGAASTEAIQARVLADASQGRPAHEAVTRAPGKAPKARPARKTTGHIRQRGELGLACK